MRPAAVGQAVVDFYRQRYPQRFKPHSAKDVLEVGLYKILFANLSRLRALALFGQPPVSKRCFLYGCWG